ncbi:hypothetical protein G6F50_015702 [Rhizopus delemar]|uniref:Acetohydroxy-acid reductoisomerase n=1 Tax=Rhizopus delemar TaxID=936053 RepID=A0A9P6XWX5_9FUNG|nr:hypothetical protein G6F50_015702 [Rhizopus delemar]
MKEVLKDIQDGTFTKNWVAEYEAGLPNYNKFKQADLEHPIEKVGKELRAKMLAAQWRALADPGAGSRRRPHAVRLSRRHHHAVLRRAGGFGAEAHPGAP